MSAIIDFVRAHQGLVLWVGTASLALLVVTVIALPVVVANLPEDYFVRRQRSAAHRGRRRPVLWAVLALVQNALGVVFIIAGLVMLILPGQGILTILVGLALTNFPGKYAVERALVRSGPVWSALNRFRTRAGRPPLILPGGKVDPAPLGPPDEEPPEPDASV